MARKEPQGISLIAAWVVAVNMYIAANTIVPFVKGYKTQEAIPSHSKIQIVSPPRVNLALQDIVQVQYDDIESILAKEHSKCNASQKKIENDYRTAKGHLERGEFEAVDIITSGYAVDNDVNVSKRNPLDPDSRALLSLADQERLEHAMPLAARVYHKLTGENIPKINIKEVDEPFSVEKETADGSYNYAKKELRFVRRDSVRDFNIIAHEIGHMLMPVAGSDIWEEGYGEAKADCFANLMISKLAEEDEDLALKAKETFELDLISRYEAFLRHSPRIQPYRAVESIIVLAAKERYGDPINIYRAFSNAPKLSDLPELEKDVKQIYSRTCDIINLYDAQQETANKLKLIAQQINSQ